MRLRLTSIAAALCSVMLGTAAPATPADHTTPELVQAVKVQVAKRLSEVKERRWSAADVRVRLGEPRQEGRERVRKVRFSAHNKRDLCEGAAIVHTSPRSKHVRLSGLIITRYEPGR